MCQRRRCRSEDCPGRWACAVLAWTLSCRPVRVGAIDWPCAERAAVQPRAGRRLAGGVNVSLRSQATLVFLLAVVACTVGGCGGSGKNAGSRGATVDFYSSLPLSGASSATAQAIVNGAKLALAQARGRAGRFTIRYISLDDSTAQSGTWNPGRTAANAREAARDPKAVYYIGELDSDASKVSMPILNRAGVPQVSPASTYVGLTTSEPGSLPGEPNKYFPTGRRTFLRIVPLDTNQAAALIDLMGVRPLRQNCAGARHGLLRARSRDADPAPGVGVIGRHRLRHRDRHDRCELPLLRPADQNPRSELLHVRWLDLPRRGQVGQGSRGDDSHGPPVWRRRHLRERFHEPRAARHPGADRTAIQVHPAGARPSALPRREELSLRLPGGLRKLASRARTRSTGMQR